MTIENIPSIETLQFRPSRPTDAPPSDQRKTLTRADLTDAVFRKAGLSRAESAHVIMMLLGEIGDALCRGENVKLSGFGNFQVRAKRERVGRNPKTGVEAKIPPRNVLVFKPSNILRQRVAGE